MTTPPEPATDGDGPAAAPPGAPDGPEDATWVEDRTGAVVNTAFIAAALSIAGRPPLRDSVALLGKLVRRPQIVAEPIQSLVVESGRILAGRSASEPWRGDRRYGDPAWKSNPFFRTLAQGHAALARAAAKVIDGAELEPVADYRLRLAVHNAVEALSPANSALLNPSALKATIDTGGANIVRGAARFAHDMRRPPRLPQRSDPGDFQLGSGVAATPGSVVHRAQIFELIQYRERTRRVHEEPVLIVPSVVNKYYLTDMSPGRSLAEYAVKQGRQVFSMSWVNPDESHREEGQDAYIAAIVEGIRAARAVSGSDRVHVLGVCAGGQLASIALAHLATVPGELERVASLTLLVCALDYDAAGLPQGLLDDQAAEVALRPVLRRGFVDGREMTAALAWLRPADSVWWPWMQRYLIGADMPKLDLFSWSEDVTNLSAAFVCDQFEITRKNSLVHPGSLTVLGAPVDLAEVTVDAYVVAGRTDHLTPWEACYRATQMLGSSSRFVLVDGGHIQSILRPPTERIVQFFHGPAVVDDAQAWLEGAEVERSSWWDDWIGWLDARSPEDRPLRRKLGSQLYPVLEPAPGSYVRKRLDHP
jgi:polyhydroxyalkanoate synthase